MSKFSCKNAFLYRVQQQIDCPVPHSAEDIQEVMPIISRHRLSRSAFVSEEVVHTFPQEPSHHCTGERIVVAFVPHAFERWPCHRSWKEAEFILVFWSAQFF